MRMFGVTESGVSYPSGRRRLLYRRHPCHSSAMTPQIDTWSVTARPGGWLRLQESDGDARVYLRYRLSGPHDRERLVLSTIVMTADGDDDSISGRVWRRLPLTKVERMLAPLVATDLTAPQARLVGKLREAFAVTTESEAHLDALADYFEKGESIDDLMEEVLEEAPAILARSGRKARSKHPGALAPPDGRLTDDFLKHVTELYRYHTSLGKFPARAIAEECGVPVRTVHRWVYEARNRGIMPKGRSGRAG